MVRLLGLSIQNATVISDDHREKLVCWAAMPGAREAEGARGFLSGPCCNLSRDCFSDLTPAQAQPCSPATQVLLWAILSGLLYWCPPLGLADSLGNATGLRLLKQQRRQDSPPCRHSPPRQGTRDRPMHAEDTHLALALPVCLSVLDTYTHNDPCPFCPLLSYGVTAPTHLVA